MIPAPPTRPGLGLAAALVLAAASRLAAQSADALRTEPLAPNVYRIAGGDRGSVLVLTGADGVLLVDSQDETTARQVDSLIVALTPAPVRYVINTHYHQDHARGNAYFQQRGATVIAHEKMIPQAMKDTTIVEWGRWRRRALPAEAVPRRTFRDSLTSELYGERVTIYHLPAAHTDGDAVVWLPEANVLHAGDIVEVGTAPFIDWWAGGSLDGLIAASDWIIARTNDSTRIVPGHGAVTDRAGVRRYREMLVTIRDRVVRAVRAKQTREQLLADHPTKGFDDRLGGEERARQFAALVHFGLARRDAKR